MVADERSAPPVGHSAYRYRAGVSRVRRGRSHAEAAPRGAETDERHGVTASKWGILLGLSVATFLLLLDDTAVSVALPSIQRRLGMEFAALQWVVTGYSLVVAAFTLLAGRLADRHGARRMFLLGLGVFIGASLVVGAAPSAPVLIAFRALQGFGAAFVGPAALSLLARVFPEGQRGAALGVWAGVSASALGLGPLVGALITDSLGWQWIFLLNVPLGVGAWLLARFLVPASPRSPLSTRLDVLGGALSAAALLALIMALDQGVVSGWTSPQVVSLALSSALLFVLFVARERRTPDPLVRLGHFRNRVFAGANIITLISTAVMCSLFFFLALYLQTVLGFSAIAAGATLLPLTVTIIAVAPLAGRLADRFGARLLVGGGMLLLAVALLGMSTLGPRADVPAMALWFTVAGLGIALARTPTTTAGLGAAAESYYGVAAGILNTSQAAGLAFGIALMGAILGSFGLDSAGELAPLAHHDLFVQGFSAALTINSVIAALAAVIALVLFRRDPGTGGGR